jgi:hypothetical protein
MSTLSDIAYLEDARTMLREVYVYSMPAIQHKTGAQIRALSRVNDKAEHARLRNYWRGVEQVALRIYAEAVDFALNKYGDQGHAVSGVVREHFPKGVKDDLRKLAHLITDAADAAELHRKASGARK